MNFIKSLTLVAGPHGPAKPLQINLGTVTVIVGPNHSGKTKLLQEIDRKLPHAGDPSGLRILSSIELNVFDETTRGRIRAELDEISHKYWNESGEDWVRLDGGREDWPKATFDAKLDEIRDITSIRKVFGSVADNIADRFKVFLGGSQRLEILIKAPRGDLRKRPTTTLGILFRDDRKRAEFQRIVHSALGWHFGIDPTHENTFRTVISDKPIPPIFERSLSDDALKHYSSCEDITHMSDGVKAFAGMIAAVVASDAKVVLVDEPEAFLHPALCTKLAIELCRKARENGQQLIFSTHSAPFVLGCIQAGVDLNIVRLTYRHGAATSRLLDRAEIIPLMRQPLLRSSGAINGVFYEAVIITEGESDRAFYDEINHRCITFESNCAVPDCLFLNAQNWQTTGRIMQTLRGLGVAAAAIIDFDTISHGENSSFQMVLEAAGMPGGTRKSIGQLRSTFSTLADPRKQELKKHGGKFLTGSEKEDLHNLISQLADYGLFVVPKGELESWLPDLPRRLPTSRNEKREWLIATFEAMGEDASARDYVRPAADDVWAFMGRIRRWVHNPQRRGMDLTQIKSAQPSPNNG